MRLAAEYAGTPIHSKSTIQITQIPKHERQNYWCYIHCQYNYLFDPILNVIQTLLSELRLIYTVNVTYCQLPSYYCCLFKFLFIIKQLFTINAIVLVDILFQWTAAGISLVNHICLIVYEIVNAI